MVAARQFTFLWPSMLALLILVPALIVLDLRLGRRKRHPALYHPVRELGHDGCCLKVPA